MKKLFTSKKKLLFLVITLLMVFCQQETMAQSQRVAGNVSDVRGEPLPGATVAVKGTTKGASTDMNGNFQIQLTPEENTLVITMVGFTTKEIPVSFGRDMKIVLEESVSEIKEVVVVGYGSVTKKEITGAVSIVKASQINKMPVRSAADILQGKAAGVTVSQSSGSPGSASVVHVRGIGSINGSTDPLYVVDGLPQNDINYLNPNDIESIAVHKDASVAAIYGSRASNGVIIVTTKSGSENNKVT